MKTPSSGAEPTPTAPVNGAKSGVATATSTGLTRRRDSAPWRIMARLIAERKPLFVGNLGLRLIKDLLPFIGPILIGIIVDLLSGTSGRDRSLLGIDLQQNSVRAIVIVAICMGLLAIAKAAVGYAHTIVAAHMGRHVVQAARRDLANAAMKMSIDQRRRFNSGDLLDRCLADSKGLRSFTQNVIIRVISNTVRAVFPLVYMFMIDPLLAVVVLAVIPLQSSFSAILQRRLRRQTHEARARESTHTSAVKEAIDGWNNVASVGGQEWAAHGIHATAEASEDAKIVKKHTTASISVVISLCTAMGIAAVYAIGGWRIISSGALDGTAEAGALTLGTLTAFIGVAKKTYAPFQAYTKIVSSYRTGLVNLERIADVLDAPMIEPRSDGPDIVVTEGNIDLYDVSFSYDDDASPTLRGLTGQIPGRSLTVITGSSGSGKTTLLRLLLGLEVPATGSISIDGQDINVAKLSSLQHVVSLVPQEPMLFTGSMGENLLLGLDGITTAELLEACDRAGLLEMVRALPKGLDTEVGSGKHMLSGGQLRRVAITRALLRDPAVMLLDEPTTGLDVENSSRILSTLRRISDHTTVVMVSHRSEPLLASDHHLILQDGGWAPAPSDRKTSSTGVGGAIPFPSWDGPQLKPAGGTAGAAGSFAAAVGSTSNGDGAKPFNSIPSYAAKYSDRPEAPASAAASDPILATEPPPPATAPDPILATEPPPPATAPDPILATEPPPPATAPDVSTGVVSDPTLANDPFLAARPFTASLTNGTPANGTSTNGSTSSNGTSTNGTSTNGSTSSNGLSTNGLSTNGLSTNGLSSNGRSTNDTVDDDHVEPLPAPVELVLALSAMGRPIVLTASENEGALSRIMMISGHRANARPITTLAPAVFAQIAADEASVALASIADINPDGAYSELRQTVLGVDVETDHTDRQAAETRVLRQTLEEWNADVIIDVAEASHQLADDQHVAVAVRFHPDASGQPTPELMHFAQHLKYQLTNSPYRYDVKFVGAQTGTLAATHHGTVVELTAGDPSEADVVRALIAAIVAIYRTSSGSLQLS